MKPEDLETHLIPLAVAERMRVSGGSEASRKKLNDLDIDGSQVDEMTGYFEFFFRSERQVEATAVNRETGEERPAIIPIDGFTLDPGDDWALVRWFCTDRSAMKAARTDKSALN